MRVREIQLNVNLDTPIGSFKKDAIVSIAVDVNNTPLERFWRDRLTDSKIDNCITLLSKKTNKSTK